MRSLRGDCECWVCVGCLYVFDIRFRPGSPPPPPSPAPPMPQRESGETISCFVWGPQTKGASVWEIVHALRGGGMCCCDRASVGVLAP